MFRTAIPFGYLLFALFLLAGFVAGVTAFIVGWRWRLPLVRWGGAVLCAFVVIVVASDMIYDAALEWNPVINNDAEILGVWTDSNQALTLAPDHTFIRQEAAQMTRGTWTRNDWNLSLSWDGHTGEMRFIQFRGANRLLTRPLGDPDTWDGDLGLRLGGHR